MSSLQNLTIAEQYDELKKLYKLYGKSKKEGLNDTQKGHAAFTGCLQWILTPEEIIDFRLFNVLQLNNEKWGVVLNIDVVQYLRVKGIDPANIIFISDCIWKSTWATRISGLPLTNVYQLPPGKKQLKDFIKINNMEKIVDYTILNVPFGRFKEFKKLGQDLTRKKVLMISGSRDYHNGSAFENVEYYKYLGACFPTAKITASLTIVDPGGVSKLNIVDAEGKIHTVSPNPDVTPGDDIDVWIFATDIINKKLQGYVNAEKGDISRTDSIIVPNGIPVIFSAGKNGQDFNESNRALTTETLVRDNTKLCWATVDPSQKNIIGGLGKHKVVVTHAANEIGHLGNPKYIGPDWGCGMNCWFITCEDKADADECIKYLTHPDVIRLVKGLKSSVTSNSKAVWAKIPHHKNAAKWIQNYGS